MMYDSPSTEGVGLPILPTIILIHDNDAEQ